jgi:hypothetical protein
VWKKWVIDSGVTLSWFMKDASGSETKRFARHPLNDRKHIQVKNQYMKQIMEKGLLEKVASAPIAVPESFKVGALCTMHLIESATRAEAFYDALEESR